MVIEKFRGGNPKPVYERFAAKGRLAPEGVNYVNSWITEDLGTCYQVMDAPDRALLDEWLANWRDIVDFEVQPVITSLEARQRVLGT
jgi:hypothetical protein